MHLYFWYVQNCTMISEADHIEADHIDVPTNLSLESLRIF